MEYKHSWVYDTEDLIFSKVKALCIAKLKKKYPKINVTTDGQSNEDAKFPTVYVQFLGSQEVGKDLSNETINAINILIQVDIEVSKAQGLVVAREVIDVVTTAFKGMHFNTTMPTVNFDSEGINRYVMRFDRLIGNGDIL